MTLIIESVTRIIRRGSFIGVEIINRSKSPTTIMHVTFTARRDGYGHGYGFSRLQLIGGEWRIEGSLDGAAMGPGDMLSGALDLDRTPLDSLQIAELQPAKAGWITVQHTMAKKPVLVKCADLDPLRRRLASIQ